MFDRRIKNAEIFKDTMEWIDNYVGLQYYFFVFE